jgi:hypothetical protein
MGQGPSGSRRRCCMVEEGPIASASRPSSRIGCLHPRGAHSRHAPAIARSASRKPQSGASARLGPREMFGPGYIGPYLQSTCGHLLSRPGPFGEPRGRAGASRGTRSGPRRPRRLSRRESTRLVTGDLCRPQTWLVARRTEPHVVLNVSHSQRSYYHRSSI